ncbi:MAG TPA: hypothetical protein VGZ47_04680 [Gemmataceae bacterium]|jgi:hypothetical protein|nr:hypothetical protein [Gemmataceae bacterium]
MKYEVLGVKSKSLAVKNESLAVKNKRTNGSFFKIVKCETMLATFEDHDFSRVSQAADAEGGRTN